MPRLHPRSDRTRRSTRASDRAGFEFNVTWPPPGYLCRSVWASTIGGQVTGTITAATDVSVIGFDGVSSAITVTAGDAGVFSAGIVGADITAGKSIGIFSYGTVNGSQEAGDSFGIIAFGQVTLTSTTATAGRIFISSPSGVEAMVLTAGDSTGVDHKNISYRFQWVTGGLSAVAVEELLPQTWPEVFHWAAGVAWLKSVPARNTFVSRNRSEIQQFAEQLGMFSP